MNCPVCNKTLASTLSICPGCGAMMHDSVREELEVIKSAPLINKPLNLERKGAILMSNKPNQIKLSEPKPLPIAKPVTAELPPPVTAETKTTTQPQQQTLVEFQNRNSTLPDWRLKVQNAVRQRAETKQTEPKEAAPVLRRKTATSGANALKVEIVEENQTDFHQNEKVAAALKRIEESRQKFLVAEKPEAVSQEIHSSDSKNYPFYIAARTNEPPAKPAEAKASVNVLPKPKLVSPAPPRNANGDFDTNKLPPLQKPATLVSSFDKPLASPAPPEMTESRAVESAETLVVNEKAVEETIVEIVEETEEIDDLAPFAMRFNAGIFDLLIGSFASLILLAPFMISGGSWFSLTGFLAFLAVTSVVMFIYMTTSVGMFGRTFGMRLFSLELVDIEENDYPTFHQAAVSSSVYLLSLALGGLGFLTMFFTEEKRAVHDIVSNTIVIKED